MALRGKADERGQEAEAGRSEAAVDRFWPAVDHGRANVAALSNQAETRFLMVSVLATLIVLATVAALMLEAEGTASELGSPRPVSAGFPDRTCHRFWLSSGSPA